MTQTCHLYHIITTMGTEQSNEGLKIIGVSGVAVVFTVSWLPLAVFSLAADLMTKPLSAKQLYVTLAVCHLTAMTSAISNPIIYGWMNSNIRNELYQLFYTKILRRQPGNRSIATATTTIRNRTRPLITYNTSNYMPGSQETFSKGVTVLQAGAVDDHGRSAEGATFAEFISIFSYDIPSSMALLQRLDINF